MRSDVERSSERPLDVITNERDKKLFRRESKMKTWKEEVPIFKTFRTGESKRDANIMFLSVNRESSKWSLKTNLLYDGSYVWLAGEHVDIWFSAIVTVVTMEKKYKATH